MRSILLLVWFALGTGTWAGEWRVWFGTGADGIYLSELSGETGALSAPRRVAEVAGPGFLVRSASGKHLYAVARGGAGTGAVVGYEVQEDGRLREIARQSSKGAGSCHVDLTPDGRTLLVANYGSGSVASYAVAGTGSFGPANSVHQHQGSSVHPQRQTKPHAHGFFAGPAGRWAYAPDLGTDEVVCYRVEGGATERVGAWRMDPGTGPRHLKVGPKGEFLYVLGELSHTVVVGKVSGDGSPETVQVISVLPEDADRNDLTCSEIRIHPNGKFLYTATRDLRDEGRARLTTFKILPDGMLERVQVVPAECAIPRNFNLSPDGNWLLVAGQRSGTVPIFGVGEDGLLKSCGQKIEVPQPMCVVFGGK